MTELEQLQSELASLYCCGWCGTPTNESGHVLPDIPKKDLPLWNEAVSINGECCEMHIRNQQEYEHEMRQLELEQDND